MVKRKRRSERRGKWKDQRYKTRTSRGGCGMVQNEIETDSWVIASRGAGAFALERRLEVGPNGKF
jgi:hypothetical protein